MRLVVNPDRSLVLLLTAADAPDAEKGELPLTAELLSALDAARNVVPASPNPSIAANVAPATVVGLPGSPGTTVPATVSMTGTPAASVPANATPEYAAFVAETGCTPADFIGRVQGGQIALSGEIASRNYQRAIALTRG